MIVAHADDYQCIRDGATQQDLLHDQFYDRE